MKHISISRILKLAHSQILTFVFVLMCLLSLIPKFAFSQSPQSIPYQAVVRDASGNLLANQIISLRLTIIDSNMNAVNYREIQSITTNTLGLFTIQIGEGTPVIGLIGSIDWSASNNKYLQVEMDVAGGTNYTNMGTSKFLSVPFALHANTSSDNKWKQTGNNISNTNTGNVGIGTTTPSSTLDVNGTGKFGPYCKIGTNIAEGYYQNSQDGAYRALQTGGNQGYYFQNYNGVNTSMYVGLNGAYQGKAGINTNQPKGNLDIRKTNQLESNLVLSGQEYYQNISAGTNTGIALVNGVNRLNNKQLWIIDQDKVATQNNHNAALRLSPGDSIATINVVATNGTTPLSLAINAGGGNVGIGTYTPIARLEVMYANAGTATPTARFYQGNCGSACGQANGTALQLVNDNATNINNGARISFAELSNVTNNDEGAASIHLVERDVANGNGGLAFSTRNAANVFTERMHLSKEGMLGIGTSTPVDKLALRNGALSFHSPTNDVPYIGIDYDATTDAMRLRSNNGSALLNTTNVTIKRITGNVGIGVTAPTNKLSVVGNADFSGNVGIGTTSPTNKLTVSGTANFTGNVGIGTASPANSLEVIGDAKLCGSLSNASGNAGIGGTVYSNIKLNVESNQTYGIFVEAPSSSYGLYVNGSAAKPGGGSWINVSDARLKEKVVDYKEGLTELVKIHPVKYHYNKESGLNTDKEYVGVLAQELQKIAPYMVGTFKPRDSNNEYLSVDNSAMMYMLINAVKELNTKFEEQHSKNEVSSLEYEALQKQNMLLQKQIDELKLRIGK